MEELKLLIGMVGDLPKMAIWVLALFFAYKTIVVGSVFGIARLAINKLYSAVHAYCNREYTINRLDVINDLIIRGCLDKLLLQLVRLRGIGLTIDSIYIHSKDVEWLEKAIDNQIKKDKGIIE